MKDDSFKDFVLDQLADVPQVVARKMFGGFGLYAEGIFFGIISDGVLYFKTDAITRERYLSAGVDCFRPSKEQVLKNYFEVPADILDSPVGLCEWARESISLSTTL